MALVKHGGMAALGFTDPLKIPWWWSLVVAISARIDGIREAAAMDPDKLTAPAEFWLSEKRLEEWFESRENLRKHRMEADRY